MAVTYERQVGALHNGETPAGKPPYGAGALNRP